MIKKLFLAFSIRLFSSEFNNIRANFWLSIAVIRGKGPPEIIKMQHAQTDKEQKTIDSVGICSITLVTLAFF